MRARGEVTNPATPVVGAPGTVGPVVARGGFDTIARWQCARWFVVTGSFAVVAGGLVAAVSRPTDFDHGSWVAAYLVLVAGVGQIALGAGQAWLAATPPARARLVVEFVAWNLATLATIGGTLTSVPAITILGSVAAATGSAAFALGIDGGRAHRRRGTKAAFVGFAAMIALSSAIGILLAIIRQT